MSGDKKFRRTREENLQRLGEAIKDELVDEAAQGLAKKAIGKKGLAKLAAKAASVVTKVAKVGLIAKVAVVAVCAVAAVGIVYYGYTQLSSHFANNPENAGGVVAASPSPTSSQNQRPSETPSSSKAPSQSKPPSKPAAPSGDAGFIALAPQEMNLNDAKAFCESKNGKLPQINGSAAWDGEGQATINKSVAIGGPWPEKLPRDHFWLGTQHPHVSNNHFWTFAFSGGTVETGRGHYENERRVVCVPK